MPDVECDTRQTFFVQREPFCTNLSVAVYGPLGFCTEVIPEAMSVLLRL
jgi:hypothetical protein